MVNLEHYNGWSQGSNLGVEIFIFLETPTNCREHSVTAWVSTVRGESTREESAVPFARLTTVSRTVLGRGGGSLFIDPRSELRLGTENEK